MLEFLTFLFYFGVGIFLEFLSTLYIRFVAERHSFRAAFISFVNTILVIGIIYKLIESINTSHNFLLLIIYAAGVGTGTYLGTLLKLRKKLKL